GNGDLRSIAGRVCDGIDGKPEITCLYLVVESYVLCDRVGDNIGKFTGCPCLPCISIVAGCKDISAYKSNRIAVLPREIAETGQDMKATHIRCDVLGEFRVCSQPECFFSAVDGQCRVTPAEAIVDNLPIRAIDTVSLYFAWNIVRASLFE